MTGLLYRDEFKNLWVLYDSYFDFEIFPDETFESGITRK